MRVFFATEKPLLDEAKFFQKKLKKHLNSKLNLSDIQNCLARSYGWSNFNQFSINHKKVDTKALAQTDCLLDSLSVEDIEKLQKKKYTNLYSLIDSTESSYGYVDSGFQKFVEDVEYRRLGFLNALLNKKQEFVFEPEKYITQPSTVLAFNSYYEGPLDDMLQIHMKIAEQAYENSEGSIWINKTTSPSVIFEHIEKVSNLNIQTTVIRKEFKLHSDYRNYDRALDYALVANDCMWTGRAKAYISLIRKLARKKLSEAKNRDEFSEAICLDHFLSLIKSNSNHLTKDEVDTVENLFFMKLEKVLTLDKIDPMIYEQWGYCMMTVSGAVWDYEDLFSENGLKKNDLFKMGQHNIITCLKLIDHSVVTDLLRSHIESKMSCGHDNEAWKSKSSDRCSMVVNIDQAYAHQNPGFGVLAVQARSIGYKFNFFVGMTEFQGQLASELSELELRSIQANTKVHVSAIKDKHKIVSPFYLAFQDKDYILV